MERILVVDDEKSMRNFMVDFLTDLGYQVATAESGHMAMAQMLMFRPDVIFLDIMMPGPEGHTMIEPFRNLCPDAIIVILSGVADKEVADEAVRLGADAYITKPADLSAIRNLLSAYETACV